ncbi:MAG: hypothetical protein J5848_00895 [Bacteroidales bacterium]|nr:hypothetical protein [Bacteroidales bacterium]
MKRFFTLLGSVALFGMLMTGCSQKTYYQVYQTKPVNEDQIQIGLNGVVHEDAYCKVTYNFFTYEGNAGFWITNKTDSVMYVNLAECFFTLNGATRDYFLNRQWTQTESRTLSISYERAEKKTKKKERRRAEGAEATLYTTNAGSAGTSTSSSTATTINERSVIMIPPRGTKYFSEYHIWSDMISIAGVKETPSASKPSGTTFTAENSPITFTSYVTYSIGRGGNAVHFDDQFYVSEIINVNSKAMFDEVRVTDAHGRKGEKVQQIRYSTADRFYVTYRR